MVDDGANCLSFEVNRQLGLEKTNLALFDRKVAAVAVAIAVKRSCLLSSAAGKRESSANYSTSF